MALIVNETEYLGTNGSNSTPTQSYNTTGAKFLALVISSYNLNPAPLIGDSKGNTFVPLTPRASGGSRSQIYYCLNPIVGTNHTFTVVNNPIACFASIGIIADSVARLFDVENGASVNGTSLSTGSVTPSSDGALIVSGFAFAASQGLGITPSDYTVSLKNAAIGILLATKLQTAKAAQNVTYSTSPAEGIAATIAVFKLKPIAQFSISPTNPQAGQTVTVTDQSTGVSGLTKTWKLGSNVISQAEIDSGLIFGFYGTRTLTLEYSDGTTTYSYSRSFYVGDLVGSINVAKGTTSQYSESGITNPKYSIQGNSNVVSGTENYIDASGILHANKAETIVLKAFSTFWGTTTAYFVIDGDDNAIYNGNASNNYQFSSLALTKDGDVFEFTIKSGGNTQIGIADSPALSKFLTTNAGGFFQNSVEATGTIASYTSAVNDVIKYVRRADNKCDVYKNGNFYFTSGTLNTGAWSFFLNPNGNVISYPPPIFSISDGSYKLATKQVTVFIQPPPTVTNVVVDANRNLNSDAAVSTAPVIGYLTQRRINGGSWVTLSSNLKPFQDNENLPSAVGSYLFEYQRKAFNGVYSENWSNIASVVYVVTPTPVINDESPLAYGQIGKPFAHQFSVSGGSGSGVFDLSVQGNLPNDAVSNAGLLTIPTVGNTAYSFTLRFTDADGRITTKAFSIPVSIYAYRELCYFRNSYKRTPIVTATEFPVLAGLPDMAEDAPFKYEHEGSFGIVGQQEVHDTDQFLEAHRLKQPFLWYNPDWNETKLVYLANSFPSQRDINYAVYELTLKEV